MKKSILVVFALLLTIGVAGADGIPGATYPKDYRTVWTQTVYNGSGSEIASSRVVQWDFDTANSTEDWWDDMCPYVKIADADNDVWTAGTVPYGSTIPDGTPGEIIVKGPAIVMNSATATGAAVAPTVNTIVSAGSSGQVIDETIAGGDVSCLGVVAKASAATNRTDVSPNYSIIYVQPNLESN